MKFLALGAVICGLPLAAMGEQIQIATDIPPIAGIAQAIGRDHVTASALLGPNQSPHHVTLRPSQAKSVAQADMIWVVGPDLTPGLYERIVAVAGERVHNIIALSTLDRRTLDAEHDHDDHDHGHGGDHDDHNHDDDHGHGNDAPADHRSSDTIIDPHVWLSPQNAVLIAAAIRDELRQIDPANADQYVANFAQFEQTLADIMANAPRVQTHTNIAVSHDAYGYFQSELGDIETITLTDAAATELTPRTMAQTLSELDQKSVACFIIDPQERAATAQDLANRYNIPAVTVSPIFAQSNSYANPYLDVMADLVRGYRTCLGQ